MKFSREKIPEKITSEGPIPEGVSHEVTPEEEALLEDMEDYYLKHPYK